jgi:transposase
MSLRPQPIPPVPAATARAARGAFPKGHPYLTMRDAFERLFEDEQFAALFATRGQPAEAPWRLALVSVLQFAENLTDRPAADAVRGRIEWKYLLALELDDPGFDYSVLCEFRKRLVEGGAEALLFETLLEQCRAHKLLKAGGVQRTDSTHVLAAVRLLNRLESLGETMRHTLNALAVVAPEWVVAHSRPEWVERYERRFEEQRLPAKEEERMALAAQIGVDGFELLEALWAADTPAWLREVPAVQTLRQMWLQQYVREPVGERRRVRWRAEEDLPPMTQRIISPYDAQARYGKKRSTKWLGYKVHFTETCDAEGPLLVTDVQTTAPLGVDSDALPSIQAHLQRRHVLPQKQAVDAGYIDAATLVISEEKYHVQLVGPPLEDTSWQARAGKGFAASDFVLDWAQKEAVCPQGKRSIAWHEREERGQPVARIAFARTECGRCPCRSDCTRGETGRRLTLRPEKEHQALQAARERQRTEAFARSYACRAGIEGTHTQGVRRCGLRRSRYVGEAKTHLQHLLTGTALNFIRVGAWLMGTPRARTRESAFVRAMAMA